MNYKRFILNFFLLISWLPFFSTFVFCQEDTFYPSFDICKVVRVVDGDTFIGDCRYRGLTTVRILNLDTYESKYNRHLKKQLKENISEEEIVEKGKQAAQVAKEILADREVLLVLHDKRYGFYGRILADVEVPTKDGHFIDFVRWMKKYHRDLVFK